MIKQTEVLSEVLSKVMKELNNELLLFSIEKKYRQMFGFEFHYMGYDSLFNLVSNKQEWKVTEVSSEDGRILQEITLGAKKQEEVKKQLLVMLKNIEHKQRIKEMISPSTYFFDQLIDEIRNAFSFILIEDLNSFKKTLYEAICTVLSPKELMELSAKEWKSGKTFFRKVEQQVFGEDLYSCVFLGFYFYLELNRGEEMKFVFFKHDKEKAKAYFEKAFLKKHQDQIEKITSVMERWG